MGWAFVRDKETAGEFRKELMALAMKVAKENSPHFQKLASQILGAIERKEESID